MILVVPDIHERPDKLAHLEPLFEEAEKVYFVGDWFDSFNMKSDTRGTIQKLNDYMSQDKFESSLGNHDCHYFFSNPMFRCSGYRPQTKELVLATVPDEIRAKFKLFHRVGDLVISHAGYHPTYLPVLPMGVTGPAYPSEDRANHAIAQAWAGHFDVLFSPGEASGGRGVGGPTWLRWPSKVPTVDRFKPLAYPQIVGHTPDYPDYTVRTVVSDSGVTSYCIDSAFRDVVWIDNTGKVLEVVDLRSQGD